MVIEIDPKRVACQSFIGFGAEWDVRNYRPMEIGDAEWDLVQERVDWIDVPAVRTMMQAKWCVPDEVQVTVPGESVVFLDVDA